MSLQPCVLITRPQPEADRLAKVLQLAGYDILIDPVVRVEPLDFMIPDFSKYSAFVFTSVNAVRALVRNISKIDTHIFQTRAAFCVGDQTALEAAEIFRNVFSAAGTKNDLIRLIEASPNSGPLLYVRARDVTGDLASDLMGRGVACDSLVVYETASVPNLAEETCRRLRGGLIVTVSLFSARTAQIFFDLVQKADLMPALTPIKFLCLSEAVLKSVPSFLQAQAYISAEPSQAGMIALIKQHVPQQE
jgi:uroporphyrinogen-III synthase